QNTSRTCPKCGHTSKNNRKTQANFACVECDYTANSDFVGALNILTAGQAVSACGVGKAQAPTLKQEPAKRAV
ncbi:zinc ribbon domain-containing protein, partial [Desulfovibrio inopinatus]|uniref:zinc ribbon domain-containing protein n=1 Tax=Desulfovibrio inopinatus TaxID=102109 RepID=UPI001B7FC40E